MCFFPLDGARFLVGQLGSDFRGSHVIFRSHLRFLGGIILLPAFCNHSTMCAKWLTKWLHHRLKCGSSMGQWRFLCGAMSHFHPMPTGFWAPQPSMKLKASRWKPPMERCQTRRSGCRTLKRGFRERPLTGERYPLNYFSFIS